MAKILIYTLLKILILSYIFKVLSPLAAQPSSPNHIRGTRFLNEFVKFFKTKHF